MGRKKKFDCGKGGGIGGRRGGCEEKGEGWWEKEF